MSTRCYITTKSPGHSIRSPRQHFGPSMGTSCAISSVEAIQRQCPAYTLATCWEILFSLTSSIMTTSYTVQHERRLKGISQADSELQTPILKPAHFDFILDPPPALMLGSCLVLGCSISSFTYRRQPYDRLQTPIFVLAISSACSVGYGLRVSANLIMLGLIPWSLCCAMVMSSCVHWLLRLCTGRGNLIEYDIYEKETLLGE